MKKGFTLIELLVVIAIAGVLVSIIISYNKNGGVDGSQLGTIGTMNEVFYPEATNYAVDTSGVLTADQLATLNTKLGAIQGKEIGVAVVKTTAPLSIEEYGIKLAEKWKVGNADLDNGAIIIIATEDRKVRIEVGYGLEGDINDAKAGRIIDNHMLPSLKKGDWYGAIVGGIDGINAE